MGLESIHIKNYKSIREFKIQTKSMNLLLGENGSGKTNVLSAVNYFYKNMISQNLKRDIFDKNNYLNDKVEIELTYDLQKILIRIRMNRKKGKENYVNYYKEIEKRQQNGKIVLKLTQIKNGKIYWNESIEVRKLIYFLYPLYQIDAREINLTDWEELWQDIGDLVKLESKSMEKKKELLRNIICETGEEAEKRFQNLERIFYRLELETTGFSVKEFAAYMAKMYYDGDKFSHKEQKLDMHSNGTNSFNYMSLLLYVLSTMGKTKLKEPLLLMDEPEISLHFHMLDELADILFECVEDITVISTTHSSRFVRNILLRDQENSTAYQIYKRKDYSELCLMNMFRADEKREKVFFSDQYANAFFAKILVLVEGETELEVLQNPYLRILFPILKKIEVIKGMSDKVVYRIIDTKTRHYNVPMLTLLDMDKIIKWNIENNRMEWEWHKEYPYLKKKENYYYGKRRKEILKKRKRIQAICDKCQYSYRLPFYSCVDRNYNMLLELLQEYYLNYDIIVARTTIEGMLINKSNYPLIINFLKDKEKWKNIEPAFKRLYNENDKLNFLRLLFKGKSDFLLSLKAIKKKNPRIYSELSQTIEQQGVKKTSWVSEWFEFYFSQITNSLEKNITRKKFAVECSDSENREKLIQYFKKDFYELYGLIKHLEKIYQI